MPPTSRRLSVWPADGGEDVGIRGEAGPELGPLSDRFYWAGLAKLGRMIRCFRREGVREIVMAGKIQKTRMHTPMRLWNLLPDFRMVRGLRPDDAIDWMRDELAAETREVLLVGHMPNIAALARALVPASVAFPPHGLIAFEKSEESGWTELFRIAVDRD